jgi:hypothetical protein
VTTRRRKKSQTEESVFYAITGKTVFFNQAITSIRSLRKYNRSIRVYLFIYGPFPKKVLAICRSLGVRVIKRPSIKKLYPYLVKWLALDELLETRVLFLDADTILLDDVKKIFTRYNTHDFYARQEIGTKKKSYWMGKYRVKPQIDHDRMSSIYRSVHGKEMPIFNAGVMLFNRGSFKKIRSSKLLTCFRQLARGKWPYPSINAHIRGEIALSIFLSQVMKFTWGFFPEKVVPFFYEIIHRSGVDLQGLVLHVTTAQYPRFLKNRQRNKHYKYMG